MAQKRYAKFKIFSASPQLIAEVADAIRHAFPTRSSVTTVFPSKEGDYFAFCTVYEGVSH